MSKNIMEMADAEIIAYLNSLNDRLTAGIADFSNELEFADDDLADIVIGIIYLEKSGAMENADDLFGELGKKCEVELGNRLGNLPYTE